MVVMSKVRAAATQMPAMAAVLRGGAAGGAGEGTGEVGVATHSSRDVMFAIGMRRPVKTYGKQLKSGASRGGRDKVVFLIQLCTKSHRQKPHSERA